MMHRILLLERLERNEVDKSTLEKTEGAIKNGQSRDTGNIEPSLRALSQ